MPKPPYHRCLLLNAGYEPLRIVSWNRAMELWILEKAEVLDSFPDFVRTPSRVFPTPAVVRLLQYVRQRSFIVPFSRRNVLLRDGYRCQYCGQRFDSGSLTMDHVIPRSRNGRKGWDNVVACCLECNHRKADRTPDEAGMPLLAIPRRPRIGSMAERSAFMGSSLPQWRPYLEYIGVDSTGSSFVPEPGTGRFG